MNQNNIIRVFIFLFIVGNVTGQNWIKSRLYDRQLKQAVVNYNEGRYATSEAILNKLLSGGADEYEEPALILLLKSQVALGQTARARETSKNIFSSYPQSAYLTFVMESLGDLYVNDVQYESAYRMYHRSKKLSDDLERGRSIDAKLLHLIKIRLPFFLLNELLTLETEPGSRNIHLLARANAEILSGRPDDAALTLNQVDPVSLPNTFAIFFENLLRASYEPPTSVLTVGMVLPLSGDYSNRGEAFLTGFYDGEKSTVSSNQRISILAQDSGSDGLQAIMKARKLEKMNQIKALILPLADKSTLAVASALSSSDIPIILPSQQQHDLSELNKKILHLNSTLAMAGKRAAQYAVYGLGLDSLAVISPADKHGEIHADAFIREVDRLGGIVVATEWYSGEPENLKRQFNFLRKVAFDLLPKVASFDEALGMEIDSLDALFDVSAEDFFDLPKSREKKMTSSDSSKVVLSTIQGIYFPINQNDLSYIAPQIPMYNLETTVIGNAHWQDLTVLQKENIGPHLKGLSLLTNFYQNVVDSIQFKDNAVDAYYQGFNTAQLLNGLNMDNQSRQSLSQAFANIDFHIGRGYYFAPGMANKNVNGAFQVLEFDGATFIHKGVFHGDSLRIILSQNP